MATVANNCDQVVCDKVQSLYYNTNGIDGISVYLSYSGLGGPSRTGRPHDPHRSLSDAPHPDLLVGLSLVQEVDL